MKYVVELGSGAMIYNTKFHKDWFRHSKVNGGREEFKETQTAWISHKSTFTFFKKGKWAKYEIFDSFS
jgi:hypothetical protein